MTDITGKLGVGGVHNYPNDKTGRSAQDKQDFCEYSALHDETNLDNAPSAISGRAMVVNSKKGEYVPNSEDIEKDVKEFRDMHETAKENVEFARSMAHDYYEELVNSGVEPDVAFEKAFTAGICLLSVQNA